MKAKMKARTKLSDKPLKRPSNKPSVRKWLNNPRMSKERKKALAELKKIIIRHGKKTVRWAMDRAEVCAVKEIKLARLRRQIRKLEKQV